MSARRGAGWSGLVFVAPATIYLAVFTLLPMAVAAWMSLHSWHLLKPQHEFVGLANYAALARDPLFRNAVLNTLLFALISVPMCVVSGLAVAVLVAQPLRAVGFFRTLFYLPSVSSQVALSMVWIWILLPQRGLVNTILSALGGSGQTDFLQEPRWALFCLALMTVWIGLGPRMIIFLVGLQSVPGALYEAAAIDGCGAWRRFVHVTLPMLRPTTLFVIVTTTIAQFQIFTPVYVMTQGGPRRATDVLLYHIYQEAWLKLEAGMASAMTYVLFAMILAAAILQFRMIRAGGVEGAA